MKRLNTYSLPEEILNSVTHGLGLVMGLAVGIFMADDFQPCALSIRCMQFICCIDDLSFNSSVKGKSKEDGS